jgi:hypothetical protein
MFVWLYVPAVRKEVELLVASRYGIATVTSAAEAGIGIHFSCTAEAVLHPFS